MNIKYAQISISWDTIVRICIPIQSIDFNFSSSKSNHQIDVRLRFSFEQLL